VEVVASRRWSGADREYRTIAREIARSDVDGVYLGGQIHSNGGQLLRDLRAELGQLPILAADGFSNVADVQAAAGSAAEGLYVVVSGVPTQHLTAQGRELLEKIGRTRPGGNEPNLYWAVYGAQAAEVLLDAIARSDGSRASVTEAVLDTRLEDTLLGSVAFDANGDLVNAPTTVLRVTRGGEGMVAEAADFADGSEAIHVFGGPAQE
jgi:branched-chain amino acid transport system substrate-binding protein